MRSAGKTISLVLFAAAVLALFIVPPHPHFETRAHQVTTEAKNYELAGGRWFDGKAFVRKHFYVTNGTFTDKQPKRVDQTIELCDMFMLPPFGDAHSHAFSNPGDIEKVVAANLKDGIFYGLSLTNSIRDKRSVEGFI